MPRNDGESRVIAVEPMDMGSDIYAQGVESCNTSDANLTGRATLAFIEPAERRRGGGPRPRTATERVAHFWSRVDRSGDCWLWTGATFRNGYGLVAVGRDAKGRGVPGYTHRVAFILAKGPIPDGLVVRHACDNPPCCNPAHLLLGTQADNIHDAQRQGKYAAERPGAWKVEPALRRELLDAALNGPRGTLARLCREHRVDFRHLAVALGHLRRKGRA